MNKQCTGCVVSAGTHKPAEALHQQIAEPQECSRSHPHEKMTPMCELRTEIARLTNALARAEAAAPQAVQAAVPVDMRLVPAEFVRGFSDLACNYSLQAEAPDYYHGVERDAFRDAYERCGRDLAKLRAMLVAAPAHPAEGVPAQAGPVGYVALAALKSRTHADDYAKCFATEAALLENYPAAKAIAVFDHAATQPAAQGMDVVQAAKALCKHAAKVQNINFDDYWLIHAEEFKEEAQIVLDAAQANHGEQQCTSERES